MPWDLFFFFFKNHLATDTSLCLHLFTASGNVTPRLFWRGLAASYLTDLQMKSHRRVDGPVVSHITGLDNRQSHPWAPEKQSYRIRRREKPTYMDLSEVFLALRVWKYILVFLSTAPKSMFLQIARKFVMPKVEVCVENGDTVHQVVETVQ